MSTRFYITQEVLEVLSMNQTDVQGETERALRAIECNFCKRGLPLSDSTHHGCRWHIIPDSECTPDGHGGFIGKERQCGYNPELLPLCNAGIVGAYAAAAKACDDAFTEAMCDRKLGIEACLQAALAAIRALTPADARQASQQAIQNRDRDWLDAMGATDLETEPVNIKNIVKWLIDSVTYNTVEQGKDTQVAAIASAEARARLESENEHFGEVELLKAQVERLDKLAKHWENDRDLWKQEHIMYRGAWLREIGGVIVRKTHEIDGFVLRTREVYEAAEKWWAHEKELEAAARTPDSTTGVDGTCCSCGYSGEEETPCPKQEDGHHCIHWYEGESPDSTKEPE